MLPGWMLSSSSRARLRALSISQVTRFGSRSTRSAMVDGSTVYGASSEPENAVARLVSIFSKRTTSMSPGSAPSTKNGPVSGLLRLATAVPFQSAPPASTVLVITRSPGLIRSATGWAPEKVV